VIIREKNYRFPVMEKNKDKAKTGTALYLGLGIIIHAC
jgi:hypothetical protein